MSDSKATPSKLGVRWDNDALKKFYQAYHKHGASWGKVRMGNTCSSGHVSSYASTCRRTPHLSFQLHSRGRQYCRYGDDHVCKLSPSPCKLMF